MYDYGGYYPAVNANAPRQQYPSGRTADYGPNPFVVDISKATSHNDTYRTASHWGLGLICN